MNNQVIEIKNSLARTLDGFDINLSMAQAFIYDRMASNLTPKTIGFYKEALKYLLEYSASLKKNLTEIKGGDIKEYCFSLLARGLSPATVNSRIRAFRTFFQFCKVEGYIENCPTDTVKLCKVDKVIKQVITPAQFSKVLRLLNDHTFSGARNKAFLLLAWDTMARLSELTGITLDGIQLKPGRAVRIHTKSRTDRILPFSVKTAKAIIKWLSFRRAIGGDRLFCTSAEKPLERRNVERILERLGNRAGVKINPHLIRHSSATHYAKITGNLTIVSNILGHASEKTTRIYLHIGLNDLTAQYDAISPTESLTI